MMERNEFELLLLLFIFNETAAQKANQKHTHKTTHYIFRECEMKKCVCAFSVAMDYSLERRIN